MGQGNIRRKCIFWDIQADWLWDIVEIASNKVNQQIDYYFFTD